MICPFSEAANCAPSDCPLLVLQGRRKESPMTLIDKDALLRNIQKYAGAASDDPDAMIRDVLYMIQNAEEIKVVEK